MRVRARVAAGWGNATRMTFFYACDAQPPFTIRAVTPLIGFGWSRNLEYCNNIERDGSDLLVSLGVADCGSALLRVPLNTIVSLLQPLAQKLDSKPTNSSVAVRARTARHRTRYLCHDGEYATMGRCRDGSAPMRMSK